LAAGEYVETWNRIRYSKLLKAGSANEKGPMDDVLGQLELAGGKPLG
jgi:hypothetical protein